MKRTALRRRSPIRRVNAKRLEWLRELQYGEHGDYVRQQPCCICGKPPPSFAHHYKTRGAGGTKRHLTPLCAAHHDAFHLMGRVNFEQCYYVSLADVAKKLWEERNP